MVVATNTLALQDQLVTKDIPQVQAMLAVRPPADAGAAGRRGGADETPTEPPALQAAVLKGRQNYLCMRRLREWRTNHALSPVELTVLAKVLVWLALIGEGDAERYRAQHAGRARGLDPHLLGRGHLHGGALRRHGHLVFPHPHANGAPAIRDAAADDCRSELLGPRGDRDFYWEARRAAETAHIVIVNHALLLADLVAEGRVLPPYRNLIVDETHRLEEAATDQLTYRVEWPAVQMLLRRLAPDGDLAGQVVHMADRTGNTAALEKRCRCWRRRRSARCARWHALPSC